jgi:hypothetical protein
MTVTFLYTIISGQSVRVPINLVTREVYWSLMQPYCEAPLRAQMPTQIQRHNERMVESA